MKNVMKSACRRRFLTRDWSLSGLKTLVKQITATSFTLLIFAGVWSNTTVVVNNAIRFIFSNECFLNVGIQSTDGKRLMQAFYSIFSTHVQSCNKMFNNFNVYIWWYVHIMPSAVPGNSVIHRIHFLARWWKKRPESNFIFTYINSFINCCLGFFCVVTWLSYIQFCFATTSPLIG